MSGLPFAVGTLLVAMLGCGAAVLPLRAAEEPPTRVAEARLKSSTGTTPTMRLARYDAKTGLCTAGSMQLLSKAEIAERKTAWNETSLDAGCREPAKKPVRTRALYPVDDKGKRLVGAAHLLLELDEDGSIATAHPVCATSEAFARAAAATSAKLAFSPRTCSGQPLRSVVLLQFAFNP